MEAVKQVSAAGSLLNSDGLQPKQPLQSSGGDAPSGRALPGREADGKVRLEDCGPLPPVSHPALPQGSPVSGSSLLFTQSTCTSQKQVGFGGKVRGAESLPPCSPGNAMVRTFTDPWAERS